MTVDLKILPVLGLFLLCFISSRAQNANSFFTLGWTNDLLYFPNPTDYYYSNGMSLELGLPVFKKNPLNHFLLKGGSNWDAQYSLRVVQNLYTPVEKYATNPIPGDRPFASYLYLEFIARSVHPKLGRKLKSHFQLGVLGRYAGGAFLQNWSHRVFPQNREITGWVNEVKPDVVINYDLNYELALIRSPWLQVRGSGRARLGTLKTDLTPGIQLEIGNFPDYFSQGIIWRKDRNFRMTIYGEAHLRGILYDASLTGGIFNRDKRYLGQIEPTHSQTILGTGFKMSFYGIGLQWGLKWTTAEFKGAAAHAFGFVGLNILW